EFLAIAPVDKDRAFLLHQFMHLRRVEQYIVVAIVRNGAQILQSPVLEANKGAAFDDPFFETADDKAAVDAQLCQRLACFPASIAVVAEEDGLLAGKVHVGRLEIREPDERGTRDDSRITFSGLANIEEQQVVAF